MSSYRVCDCRLRDRLVPIKLPESAAGIYREGSELVIQQPTVVIGSGPYGLSVAAHMLAAGIPTLTFGRPMEYWERMPRGMHLRSAWSASSLSDPAGLYTLDRYIQAAGAPRTEPIALRTFVEYGHWFQAHAVPDVDPTYVDRVDRDGKKFRVRLADGRELTAARAVVALGIQRFPNMPLEQAELPSELLSHSQDHRDFDAFRDGDVAVLGGGQSALETAALLNEAGARVEVIHHGTLRWLRLHDYRGPASRFLHAPSDVGPPGLNWLLHYPLVFRHFPVELREWITRRAVRPAGARWLYDRVHGHVRLSTDTRLLAATPSGGTLQLRLSDGTERQVDHLIVATGFRPSLRKLDVLGPELRSEIAEHGGLPVLNRWLESSVPRLHFVGALAGHSFGPICRFVSGARVSAMQVAAAAVAA